MTGRLLNTGACLAKNFATTSENSTHASHGEAFISMCRGKVVSEAVWLSASLRKNLQHTQGTFTYLLIHLHRWNCTFVFFLLFFLFFNALKTQSWHHLRPLLRALKDPGRSSMRATVTLLRQNFRKRDVCKRLVRFLRHRHALQGTFPHCLALENIYFFTRSDG